MKNFKKALVFVLTLCALGALFTVGAWAVEPANETLNASVTMGGSPANATASPSEGWTATKYTWSVDPYGTDTGSVYESHSEGNVSFSAASPGTATLRCDIDCELTGNPTTTGTKYVDVVITVNPAATPRPSFNIYADPSATSYLIGISSPVALSVTNKQNMNGYTVNWVIENSGAVGGLSSNIGDNVSASYTSAGTSAVKAYVIYGSEQVWAGNSIMINVSSPVNPTGVSIYPENYELAYGSGITVSAAVSPDNATFKKVSFVSSDPNIVQCTDYGNNTAFIKRVSATGNAIITATVDGFTGLKAQCSVTVPNTGTKTVFITSTEYMPAKGETFVISADFSNSYDRDNTLTHWVYDKNIIEMTYNDSNSANFTAIAPGSTKVTAYAKKDGDMYAVESNSIDIQVSGTSPVTTHQITYGNYSTFDGTNPLYFATNDSYYNFKALAVDGYTLTNGNQYYVSASTDGYIRVALSPNYLKQLSSANYHTIQIASTNGVATGYFRTYTTTYNIYGVRTGDDNNISLWACLCAIGFIGSAAIIIAKRRDIFG